MHIYISSQLACMAYFYVNFVQINLITLYYCGCKVLLSSCAKVWKSTVAIICKLWNISLPACQSILCVLLLLQNAGNREYHRRQAKPVGKGRLSLCACHGCGHLHWPHGPSTEASRHSRASYHVQWRLERLVTAVTNCFV